MKPKVIVLTGYGINCDEEMKFAFDLVGADTEIIHVRDLIDKKKNLDDYNILAFPGGFSFGDDTGSGKAFASLVKNNLWTELQNFINKKSLIIGVCNGFQIMVALGLLPATNKNYGTAEVSLEHNNSARYINRWIDLEVTSNSPWLKNINTISVPIAHGEGKFYAPNDILEKIKENNLIALKYCKGDICASEGLEMNPNGSLEDIAGITDVSGRFIGMMPHPERALFFTNRPDWTLLKEKYKREGKELPKYIDAIKIFQNAMDYFKED